MPSSFLRKPLKNVWIDTVLFFATFTLVGHITINYWERYTIQNELYSMKHSLYLLKDTVGNIGKAYDNLHMELKDMIYEINKNEVETLKCRNKETFEARCKAANTLPKKGQDFQVQAAIKKPNKKRRPGVGVATDYHEIHEQLYGVHKTTGPLGMNASTNTKNPPKSTGTSSKESENEKDYPCCYNDDHCRRIYKAVTDSDTNTHG